MYSLEACLTNADFTLDLMAATLSPGSSSSYIRMTQNQIVDNSHIDLTTSEHHMLFKNMNT